MLMSVLFAIASAFEPDCRVAWTEVPFASDAVVLSVVPASDWFAVSGVGGTLRVDAAGPCTPSVAAPRGVPAGDALVSHDASTGDLQVRLLRGSTWTVTATVDRTPIGSRTPQLVGGTTSAFLVLQMDDAIRPATQVDLVHKVASTWVVDDFGSAQLPFRSDASTWMRGALVGAWTFDGPRIYQSSVARPVDAPAAPPPWRITDPFTSDGHTVVAGVDDGQGGRALGVWTVDASGRTQWEGVLALPVAEGDVFLASVAVEGNVVAFSTRTGSSADTGGVDASLQYRIAVWRRGLSGWGEAETWLPDGNDGELGASVAIVQHVLAIGSLGRDPGVATTALARVTLLVVDADGDGVDELRDADDLDPTVGEATRDTGSAAADTDGTPTDSDAAADTGRPDPVRPTCGCASSDGSPHGARFGAVLLTAAAASRRRRTR